MSRLAIDPAVTDKTTIVASKVLLDRVGIHVKKHGDTQQEFLKRAIVNQLESEGDFEIRQMLEEVEEDGQ